MLPRLSFQEEVLTYCGTQRSTRFLAVPWLCDYDNLKTSHGFVDARHWQFLGTFVMKDCRKTVLPGRRG